MAKEHLIIKVHLLAFAQGAIRYVTIPHTENPKIMLDRAFHFGQNDFQPKPQPSVSVGDVIELPDGSLYRVEMTGFKKLEKDTDLKKLIGKVF